MHFQAQLAHVYIDEYFILIVRFALWNKQVICSGLSLYVAATYYNHIAKVNGTTTETTNEGGKCLYELEIF